MMEGQERAATLMRLKGVVEQTKSLYGGAKEALKQAKHLRADLGATHPDGNLRIALSHYYTTLRDYSLAVWRYNRFILDSTLPDKES